MSVMCGIERCQAHVVMTQPRWGWIFRGLLPQGSSCVATLGWGTESRWDRISWVVFCMARFFTPPGSCPKAQGCPARATLGINPILIPTPNGVVSRSLADIAMMPQPRWGWISRFGIPRVGRIWPTLGWGTESRWDRISWVVFCMARFFTPPGSCPKAQGCPARATLGINPILFPNPNGVVAILHPT